MKRSRPQTAVAAARWATAAALGLVVLAAAWPAQAQETRREAAYKVAVADARRAMSKREMDDASKALKVASENARTDEDRDEIQRLQTLLDYQRQFWQLLIKGAQGMKAGEEVEITVQRSRRTKAVLVETLTNGVTLRIEGVNRFFTWKTMPAEVVLALAGRALAKDNASKVALGVFHAMDEKGDRAQARKLWEEASRSGLDLADLLAELDSQQAAGAKLPPVPKDDQLQAAEEALKQEYKRLYARSGIQSYQQELARKLLADGPKVADDDAKRFVMLREARDLGAAAGDLRLAASAIEQMAALYQIDMVRMKLDTLKKASEGARGPQQYRDVVLLCLNLADDAVRARRAPEAKEALAVAAEAARNSKSRALMQQVAAAEEKLGKGK